MFWIKLQRRWYRRRLQNSLLLSEDTEQPISPLLALELLHCWDQPVQSSSIASETGFLVVDIETSSLDVSTGEILSIGWVVINKASIQLDTPEHHLFLPSRSVGQSAVVHQLRDCEFNNTLPREAVIHRFLQAAVGRVLVFHHSVLDLAFLNHLCRHYCGAPVLMPWVDTLSLERQKLNQSGVPIGSGDLRLASCRDRYNLPSFQAHNALVDALATAELLLAQLAYRGGKASLGELLS